MLNTDIPVFPEYIMSLLAIAGIGVLFGLRRLRHPKGH